MAKRIFVLLLLVLLIPMTAGAAGTGKSYTYNYRSKAVEIPDPYTVNRIVGGTGFSFNQPEDLAVYNEELYVLDSGNSRIAVLNDHFELIKTIAFTQNGQSYKTQELKGFCIDPRGIFITDKSGGKVFCVNFSGEVIKEYGKPQTELLSEDNEFLPLKVITDSTGQIYVLVENEYRGAISMTPEGEFDNFFGSSNVKVTASVLLDNFWRTFMTDEQRNSTRQYLPTEYKNFARDEDDFIYAVQGSTAGASEAIRKMNSQGVNILYNTGPFGDLNLGVYQGKAYNSNLIAIAVDKNGFITALDNTWNRIFQYNCEGELLYVFGGRGDQKGTFSNPVDLECFNGFLLVLDKDNDNITVFEPTVFGTGIREGYLLYQEGRFDESVEPWQKVLKLDGNYEKAYNGIGKAFLMKKKYKDAMSYFRLSNAKDDYSLAFQRYRQNILRDNFTGIAAGIAVMLLIGAVLAYVRRKEKLPKLMLDSSGNVRYLLHTVLHPVDGFGEMRYNKRYSYSIGALLMGAFLLLNIVRYFLDGFIFNGNDPDDFNFFITLFSTLGLMGVFILVNWLISSFFEGKGTLGGVFIVASYALFPLILSQFAALLLTNILIVEESFFITYVSASGMIWAGAIGFLGLNALHMYEIKRGILSLAASVVGILIVLFLVFLLFNLFTELTGFLEVIFKETLYRIRVGF